MSKELLIRGGHVVTFDPDLGDLPAGDVLVADGLIAAIGPDLEPTTAAAEVIDAAGRLVIPGMVDTHRHDPVAVMVLGAGPADVETVIVGGDVIKRGGKLAGDNVGHALELMHATRKHLRA